ncbi:MAG: hypothetical protein OXU79_14440 [Gemmatimonadota bacterium]|nr:hypothetical protein [Gemmatimonadota bacterium]
MDVKRKNSAGIRFKRCISAARLGSSLTHLMGNEEIQREFGFKKIPYACIVDRDGYIRYEKTGLSSDVKASIKDQLTWVIGLPAAE